MSSIDVYFDADNVYQPDIVFISANRRDLIIDGRIQGAPDIVVEILSPSNAYYYLRQKMNVYEKYGVSKYIIVDPIQENADSYILKNGVYQLHQKAQKTETLNSSILTGLSFELNKIFQ